jgi:hypothetical protein
MFIGASVGGVHFVPRQDAGIQGPHTYRRGDGGDYLGLSEVVLL